MLPIIEQTPRHERLRAWFKENIPPVADPESYRGTKSASSRNGRLFRERQIADAIAKFRQLEFYRQMLAVKLGISETDIVKAINTVFEIVEAGLAKGQRVYFDGFGFFRILAEAQGDDFSVAKIDFVPEPGWLEEINKPIHSTKIGLKYKLKEGRLIQRVLEPS